MRRFSTKIDTVSSLRGVSKCHSVEFVEINRIITLRGTSGINYIDLWDLLCCLKLYSVKC